MDVFSIRTVGHGRYHSDSARWNSVVSALFITAGILDIIAIVYWMRREMEVEDVVLLVSSYVLLAMASLVLLFQVQEIKQSTWEGKRKSDRIDLFANGIVLIITVVGVVLRHMEHSRNDYGEATNRMELALVPIWLFTSMLYVSTDMIRLNTEGE